MYLLVHHSTCNYYDVHQCVFIVSRSGRLEISKPEIVAGRRTLGVISMGSGVSCPERMQKLVGMTLIVSLLAALYINLIIGIALAGTETGEFCPTCPDWTNLDGWLAKKEAYEKAQGIGQPVGSQSGQTNSNAVASLKVDPSANGYPVNQLLTRASLIKKDQVILDVRDPQDYQSGHIPGARSLYWKDMQKGGILDQDLAIEALERAGVNSSDNLLVYGGTDEGALYAFWALSYLGQKNVSLLDGGTDAAWSAGIKKDVSKTTSLQSNYTARTVPWLLVTPVNLERLLARSDVQILDARDYSDYGMSMLTNAISLTAEMLYNDDTKIKDPATLNDLLGRRSLDENGTQIVYGTPQAYRLFYSLKLMGYNATLLEGDWWMKTKWAVSSVK
jgi:thiosulfate/3-mercaptopyruvate sulfurtransferase